MKEIPCVIEAINVDEHKIRLAFNDGVRGVVDFSEWLEGPVFEPLKDPDYFKSFFLDGGTVSWPNGADIAPETLLAKAKSTEAA